MSSTTTSTTRTFTLSLLFITILLANVCTANLATGRASLRPSAGKRSAAVFVGRSPAHYYQLAAAKRLEQELTCGLNTMTVLSTRYQQLQDEIEEIVELMEACQTINSL
ncbi:unnamed protein product [Caenorhabditis brenneri]